MRERSWVGDTSPLQKHAAEIQTSYREILHEQIQQVVSGQFSVSNKIQSVEKHTIATSVYLNKQLKRVDFDRCIKAANEFDYELNIMKSNLSECIASVDSIARYKEIDLSLYPSLAKYIRNNTNDS